MGNKKFDVVILGGGPGGYVAAIRAAQLGLSTCLVEKEHLGGICLNWGCIPTKAMLKSAEVFSLIKRASSYGLKVDTPSYDLNKIVDRAKKIADKLSSGVEHLLKKNKVTVIHGKGIIKTRNKVIVQVPKQTEEIEASNIIIATGARPRDISGLEADGDRVWNYKHALRPVRLPKKLLIVGSGAIGVEFATFDNSLGCETVLIELLPSILPNEDKEVSSYAKKEFTDRGIAIFENTSVTKISPSKSGVTVGLNSLEKSFKVEVDTIIMATGIIGNTEDIGISELGLSISKGHLVTDEFARTSISNIYAIGDVTHGPWLAHKASHEAVKVIENIALNELKPVRSMNIAGCTFCEPQIASIGLSEEKATDEGYKIRVGKFPLLANGKALAIGESKGFIKTIFNSKTGELIGAHLIGPEVTELIHSFVLGQQMEGTDKDFIETIFPHPTLSESIHESVLNSENRTIHF